MTTKALRRPEVRLGTCTQDGCMLLRQYDEAGQHDPRGTLWQCVACGHMTYDDASPDPQVAGTERTAA